MSSFKFLLIFVLSCLALGTLAGPAVAAVDREAPGDQRISMESLGHRASMAMKPTASATCVENTNCCDNTVGFAWGYVRPSNNGTGGSFQNPFTMIENSTGLGTDTIKAVYWYLEVDTNSDSGYTSGAPDLRLSIIGDSYAGPDTNNVLAVVDKDYATWTAEVTASGNGGFFGFVPFDIADVVIPPAGRVYAMIEVTNRWEQNCPDGEVVTALFVTDVGDPSCENDRSGYLRIRNLDPACPGPGGATRAFHYLSGLFGCTDLGGPAEDGDPASCPENWSMYWESCPAPYEFSLCTPVGESDWEAQGNGNERTNVSSANFSSLCGITQAWSRNFSNVVQTHQPLIVGDRVLVSSTDTLHCLSKADGSILWEVGFYPYITGDLRGAPTVDVANERVYFGGANAQSFTCVDLTDGTVIWNRDLVGGGYAGATSWTPSVLINGVLYFTQETGRLFGVDATTGLDIVGSPLTIPGPARPRNGLTSDGTKLWIGTADDNGGNGSIFQVDAATMTIEWTLSEPGSLFPGNVDSLYDGEGFPGTFAYENGILYYHSMIWDAVDQSAYPGTGSLGAIDVSLEDGTGAGILWTHDAQMTKLASPGSIIGTFNYSGPAVGEQLLWLNSRGYWGNTAENRGVQAWDKTLGLRVWIKSETRIGVSNGVVVTDLVRGDAPVSAFCMPDGTPYLFAGNTGGIWRLFNGNTGEILFERTFTGRVRGTALADDFAVTVVRSGYPGAANEGSVVAFTVGQDRPVLQIDTQYVFRTAVPGDGLQATSVTDAIRNTGCVDLTINAYSADNPPLVRVSSVHPALTSSAKRSTDELEGFEALLDAPMVKRLGMEKQADRMVVEEEAEQSLVRTFANSVTSAADPLFLAVTEAPGILAPGAAQSIAVTYDETGLSNNTPYENYIEIDCDDPDYYPQDPTGADLGLPYITFELFIGCPDDTLTMDLGQGTVFIANFGAYDNNADSPLGLNINGSHAMFQGGFQAVVAENANWASDGGDQGGSGRYSEFGPTLPCGLEILDNTFPNPAGGTWAYKEVSFNMIDIGSTHGYFTPGERQLGGMVFGFQRVGGQDADFGDFEVVKVESMNDPEIPDDGLEDIYVGTMTDWDIFIVESDSYWEPAGIADYGYVCADGGEDRGAASECGGHARLDAPMIGATGEGAFGAPVFTSPAFGGEDDVFGTPQAFFIFQNPDAYWDSVKVLAPAATFLNTDVAASMSFGYAPSLADGESFTVVYCAFNLVNGEGGVSWSTEDEFDAAVTDAVCRAKAFAGYGKGDVNCDGCVDLADVVLLGNIIDGLVVPSGAATLTSDANGDDAISDLDYNLLYDVVAGVQPASALANGWRF